MNKTRFTTDLLEWYGNNKRILPWRENTDPYRVWISEIMLQQTRVEAVIPFFNRFIETLPTIEDCANASEDSLNKLWEGLGYYSRVRNIRKAANIIMNEYSGVFPDTYEDMLSLPGIGPYTAGAISSIEFNMKHTAVDGNVLRVFSRLYAIRENIKDITVKKNIKEKVESLLPKRKISEFNQGLMEIGATICIPNGKPKCSNCPFSSYCLSNKKGLQNVIPFIERKKKRTVENKTVVILRKDNLIAISKRPPTGLLAGLYEFPLYNEHFQFDSIKDMYQENIMQSFILDDSKHLFTHKEWIMKAYLIDVIEIDSKYLWVTIDDLKHTYSIPNAYKAYKKFLNII